MLSHIENKVAGGKRLSGEEGLELLGSDDLFRLGRLADTVCRRINGRKAYYVRNRHINPTNICLNRCGFCAFSRSKGEEGAYELSLDEIAERVRSAPGGTKEIHIVGGLHPDWPFEHYLDIVRTIKRVSPGVHVKAFTAVEIDHFSRISGRSIEDTLRVLKDNGLDAMPGGGAEIFSQPTRDKLCPEKISGERWLEVHEAAHGAGIKTNATILYGHVESFEDRIDHLMRLRKLQDRTGGFQAFIPLSYHPKNTEMGGEYPSAIDDLKTIAVSRLMLDNIPHIKAYWIMLGEKISQLALLFGADDIDGTVIEEKITHSAGALTGESLTGEQMAHLIRRAGKVPVERDALYRTIE
ncbi:MAG: aminofutalosine synthase MqnE [Nitrospirota bacterium]|nr:MAG: aminofutalosine synthase MqnE [Nitrospirota bacterium]